VLVASTTSRRALGGAALRLGPARPAAHRHPHRAPRPHRPRRARAPPGPRPDADPEIQKAVFARRLLAPAPARRLGRARAGHGQRRPPSIPSSSAAERGATLTEEILERSACGLPAPCSRSTSSDAPACRWSRRRASPPAASPAAPSPARSSSSASSPPASPARS
jgi:hypothetical protein